MTTLRQQSSLSAISQLTEADKQVLAIEFGKLTTLRKEKVSDYCFELWFEYFQRDNYNASQIFDMIQLARHLPKFGHTALTYGDLTSNYDKWLKEEDADYRHRINWTEFFRVLAIYEQSALSTIHDLHGHIPLEDYQENKALLRLRFKKLYGIED